MFKLIVLVPVYHRLVPHLVPNSPCVPLRNVSWGFRCVLCFGQVRLFPSPPALFWPFARRLCPLFSSFCLSGLTRLRPGVCVCVCLEHLKRCKTSTFVKVSLYFFIYFYNFLHLIYSFSSQAQVSFSLGRLVRFRFFFSKQGDTAFHWDCVQRSYQ